MPTFSVDANGFLTLTDAKNNAVTLSTTDGKMVYATFTAGSGSAAIQELAALGTVSIPADELSRVITSLSGTSTLYENITDNSTGTFDVAFSTNATKLIKM